MHNYQLDEMLKDLKYLYKMDMFFRSKGITIDQAKKEDFYSFITESHKGEIDFYTGKPITSISYDGDMAMIADLLSKYKKLKAIIELVSENEVL